MFLAEGAKTFRLIDPLDNRRMYEGHMREAQLELIDGRLERSVLLEATSMVHTPVEFDQPDFDRYLLAIEAVQSTMVRHCVISVLP